MSIKSSIEMVNEAKLKIKNLSIKEAITFYRNESCVFIDLRDIRELEKNGKIKNSIHVPRGMLEFWIDPKSIYYKDYFSQNKMFLFYCASGWRSALSVLTINKMGFQNALNLEDGFNGWLEAKGPIEKLK